MDEGEGEKVVGRGSRWREECKGGLCRRPVESDEERAARAARARGGGGRKRERETATREMRGGNVGEDRKRKRETETDSVLDPPGIDAFVCQNAETPASFLPSFLLSSPLFSSVALLSYSLCLSPSLSAPVLRPVSLSRSLSWFSVSLFCRPSLSLSVAPSREFRPPCFHVVLLTLTPVLLL